MTKWDKTLTVAILQLCTPFVALIGAIQPILQIENCHSFVFGRLVHFLRDE